MKVLVVDDEAQVRQLLAAALKSGGHEVEAVATGPEALEKVRSRALDLVLLDLNLGGESGLDLIPEIRALAPEVRVIVITGQGTIESAVEAMRRGAYDYLLKPVSVAEVILAASKVAEVQGLERRVVSLEHALGQYEPKANFESSSPLMQQALLVARQIADSPATVLLTGESGTGKTMLASAIHSWSRRASQSFATVSCPTLSDELLASELFGHVRGAFTGAVRDNPGRFSGCDGGTLFLDEIGDLPLSLQPKLLRFLQERVYERVGENQTRQADVRIIAATNLDLESAVREGRFREDLYYRVNVVEIALPPLRERAEDIVALAKQMATDLCRANGRPVRTLSSSAMEALRRHSWPGNIRELRNAIERAVLLSSGEEIGAEYFPAKVSLAETPPAGQGGNVVQPAAGDPISLETMEEAHIRTVLAKSPSIEEAAAVLGLDTVTFWRRRKKYGI